jgi:uncharacterized membrane protein YozB (DUF420 family)
MDANVAYWTAAWVNMVVMVGLGCLGVFFVRRDNVQAHRIAMLTATGLVLGFVVSYAIKVALLGREALGDWERFYVITLRVHETFVAFMLVGGAVALTLALRRGFPIDLTSLSGAALDSARAAIRLHRRAGWTAIVASFLAACTAFIVLYGMYARIS